MKKKYKKKLVLIISKFPQISETFIVKKFLGLLKRGWDVHIVCDHFDRETWAKFPDLLENLDAKKRVHSSLPTEPQWQVPFLLFLALIQCLLVATRSTWNYLKLGWKLHKLDIFRHFYLDAQVIQLNPEIVHFEFGTLVQQRTYLKKLLKAKFSVSFRGYDLNYIGLGQPDYYKRVWEIIDKAHFLGEDLWHRALQRGAPENMPHSLIPPAIDLSQFPKPILPRVGILGSLQQPLRIISVGRLHWKKGYEYSLQAVRQLLDQGVHCKYYIIGDGSYTAALYYARYQMGLESYVNFFGALPHLQVIEHIQWADVFLHGAISEGFCNSVLEAQAMGLPVVCTDADGLPENVLEGVTGFVVPRRDPTSMAEKLKILARNEELRARMGISGRKRVNNLFLIQKQLDSFEDFYDSF